MQIEASWRYSDKPILCFDGDSAGKKAAARVVARALPLLRPGKTLLFCYLPNEMDPDDFLKENGSNEMQKYLDNSEPLVNVLWRNLVEKNYKVKINSDDVFPPEDKAALKKDILQATAAIQDPEIKNFYRQFLLDEFWKLVRGARTKNSQLQKGDGKLAQPLYLSKPKASLGQKILLGILLKYPELLSEVGELLLRIDFSDKLLSDIGIYLLDKYFSAESPDDELFHLKCNDYLSKIGSNVLQTHASFLFDDNVSLEEVSGRWKEIWFQTIWHKGSKEDMLAIGEVFKRHFDGKAWQQMRALFFDTISNN
jgi:DNA primase